MKKPASPVAQATSGGKAPPGASATPAAGGAEAVHTEAPDTTGVTTVKEYKYVPAEKLPPVKGVSQLQVGRQPQDLGLQLQRLGRLAAGHRRQPRYQGQ